MFERLPLILPVLLLLAVPAWAESREPEPETAGHGLFWGQGKADVRNLGVVLTNRSHAGLENVFLARNLPEPPEDGVTILLYFGPGDRLYGMTATGGDRAAPGPTARQRFDALATALRRSHGAPLATEKPLPLALSLGGTPMKAVTVQHYRGGARFVTLSFTVLNTGAELWSLSTTHLGLYREMFQP